MGGLFASNPLDWTFNQGRSSGPSWKYSASLGQVANLLPSILWTGLLKRGHLVFLGYLLLLLALPATRHFTALLPAILWTGLIIQRGHMVLLGDILLLPVLQADGRLQLSSQPLFGLKL